MSESCARRRPGELPDPSDEVEQVTTAASWSTGQVIAIDSGPSA
jgi:hypothetical protein